MLLESLAASAVWRVVKAWWPVIVGFLVLLVVVMSVLGYGLARYNAGKAEAEAKFAPKLAACAADRDGALRANKDAETAINNLKAAYGDLETAVKQLEARERVARLRGERIAAELAKKEREFIQEAQRLHAIINGPRATTAEAACAGADLILLEEAQRRSSGRIS